MPRKVKFLMGGKVHKGQVVRENPLSTIVQVRNSKLDIMAMTWTKEIRDIKRHNIKHQVQPCG